MLNCFYRYYSLARESRNSRVLPGFIFLPAAAATWLFALRKKLKFKYLLTAFCSFAGCEPSGDVLMLRNGLKLVGP